MTLGCARVFNIWNFLILDILCSKGLIDVDRFIIYCSKSKLKEFNKYQFTHKYQIHVIRSVFSLPLILAKIYYNKPIVLVKFLNSDFLSQTLVQLGVFKNIIYIDDGTFFINSNTNSVPIPHSFYSGFKSFFLTKDTKADYMNFKRVVYGYFFNYKMINKNMLDDVKHTIDLNSLITLTDIKAVYASHPDPIVKNLNTKNPVILGSSLVEHGYCSMEEYKLLISNIADRFTHFIYKPHPSETHTEWLKKKYFNRIEIINDYPSELLLIRSNAKEVYCFGSTTSFIMADFFTDINFYMSIIPEFQSDQLRKELVKIPNNIYINYL